MKVVQQTSTLLKLQERPIGIWIISTFTVFLGLFIFIGYEWPVDFFGFLCIVSANFMMFWSPVKTCSFNKNLNWVTLKEKGWLGTQIRSYSLDTVAGVKVEESKVVGTRFYRLILMLRSGKQFYLNQIPSTDWKLQRRLANYIHQFIQPHLLGARGEITRARR